MTILAAIGGEHEQDRVVDVGYDLATVYEDDLVVLHVMEEEKFEEIHESTESTNTVVVPGGDENSSLVYQTSRLSDSSYNIEDAMIDAGDVAEECVSQTLPNEDHSNITTKGRVGDPATEISGEADRLDVRYIVVGGRKRSPVGKALFGSVAQSVILNSDRPVVAITRNQ